MIKIGSVWYGHYTYVIVVKIEYHLITFRAFNKFGHTNVVWPLHEFKYDMKEVTYD